MRNIIEPTPNHIETAQPGEGWINPDFDPDLLPARRQKGRGAVSNIDGRFERHIHQAVDDGWMTSLMEDQDAPRIRTTLGIDGARSVITRNQSPDVPFDRSINPYRGCEHGCIYCFARPTHAYLGLSPGLDFETKLFWKPDAPTLLRKQLAVKSYMPAPIVIGTSTDPYQPVDREKQLTRSIIRVLGDCQHPFSIITKGALVTRDIDLIAPMAAKNRASVAISVTSLDHRLSNLLEPRASAPHRRLDAIRKLADAGIPVTVLCAPIIPGLNDMEIENLVAAVHDAGATSVSHIVIRLPLEIRSEQALLKRGRKAAPLRPRRHRPCLLLTHHGGIGQNRGALRRVGDDVDVLQDQRHLGGIPIGQQAEAPQICLAQMAKTDQPQTRWQIGQRRLAFVSLQPVDFHARTP